MDSPHQQFINNQSTTILNNKSGLTRMERVEIGFDKLTSRLAKTLRNTCKYDVRLLTPNFKILNPNIKGVLICV